MIASFLPFKKLRRNSKCLLFWATLVFGAVVVYHEMVATKARSDVVNSSSDVDYSSWWRDMFDKTFYKFREDHQLAVTQEDSTAWRSSYTPQTWKPEFKGQANLHAFDDWCGSTTADLRKNMHYPLHPHSRTTVKKLAVFPNWANYGLRIFGYLHPYIDGEFVFAVSSDDNSEFWLSTDDSPLNVQLLAFVGKTGNEWTVPGEFEKYASQTSAPVFLYAQRRYFFEVIHKQNDKGTDHVEVAWKLLDQGFRFMVIESNHISLYVDESALLPSDVEHIPQTAASHRRNPIKKSGASADMLREDPRDTFHQVALIHSKFLKGVLPDCSYNPSYTIKGFQLVRYQGLEFVHSSYIYPNDYTRLTHLENVRSCIYPERPEHMKMFGFSRYMMLEPNDIQEEGNADKTLQRRKSVKDDEEDFDLQETESMLNDEEDFNSRRRKSVRREAEDFGFPRRRSVIDEEEDFDNEIYPRKEETWSDNQINNALFPDYGDDYDDYVLNRKRKLFFHIQAADTNASDKRLQVDELESTKTPGENNEAIGGDGEQLNAKEQEIPTDQPTSQHTQNQRLTNSSLQHLIPKTAPQQPRLKTKKSVRQPVLTNSHTTPKRNNPVKGLKKRYRHERKQLREKEIKMNTPLQLELETSAPPTKHREEWKEEEDKAGEDDMVKKIAEADVKWSQTFQVSYQDLHALRSDRIDFECKYDGNPLLPSSDALPVIKAFMDSLNKKHHGQFTLERVVNVVKRVDMVRGSRYLLELELKDENGQLLRLSHYIYTLIRMSRQHGKDMSFKEVKPQLVLCNPLGFRWNPAATVHFIVPVKNQARWVLQLITEMEKLFKDTQDANFNLIITDYSSTDMDIRKALEESSLTRYEYLKLSGNFERSAGLQAGINLINDSHSIVFLCDLHIHFPSSIIDTIRKHCVEGHMAFAPIVMRLDCGASPSDAKGFWEVQGFGLLGIYKSDLDKVGGMNTEEFKDTWGGEDWELIDRILQAGLEVERIHLRNFFHSFHSKRGMWNKKVS